MIEEAAIQGTLLAAAATWLLIWLLKPAAMRFNLLDHPRGRKAHEAPTPVTGGLAMTLGVAIGGFAAWSNLSPPRQALYLGMTLLLAVPGTTLLNQLLKHAYERARPHFDDPLLSLESYSFPSGHAAGATAFYMVLAAFLVSRTYDRRHRAAIVSVAAIAVRN